MAKSSKKTTEITKEKLQNKPQKVTNTYVVQNKHL